MGLKKLYALCWLVLAVALFVTPAHAQFSPPAGGGAFTGPFPQNPIDPTILYGAGDGVTGTFTGINTTSGTNSIVVQSASNWVVGRPITFYDSTNTWHGCVNTIVGTTFTIVICGTSTPVNSPTTATMFSTAAWPDDLPYLNQAVTLAASTGRPIVLQGLVFNISDTWTIPSIITVRGSGDGGAQAANQTQIAHRKLTGDTILVSNSATLSDFWIIGPSAGGYGLNLENSGGGACANIKPNIQRVDIINSTAGLRVGLGITDAVVRDMYIYQPTNEAIYYTAIEPCGDNILENIVLAGNGTAGSGDFIIYATDTTTFNQIKLGAARIYFIHESFRSKWYNIASEDGNYTCFMDFGTAFISGLTYVGGEIAQSINAFCNTQQALSSTATNIIGYSNGTSCTGGRCSGGTGILNYIWPPPLFSGCGTNGAVHGNSDLQNGIVAMTCSSATMTITYNAGPNSVPDNGLLCEVYDITDPTKLFLQTGYSITNNGVTTSAAYATFANVSTAGSDTLKYHCSGF